MQSSPFVISKPTANQLLENKQWSEIFKKEEGELCILELIEECVQRAGDVVYEHYIQRRVVPYAVAQAKLHLIQILQYFFLECDKGEPDAVENSTWHMDEEPLPDTIDSWARNCIPVEPHIQSLYIASNPPTPFALLSPPSSAVTRKSKRATSTNSSVITTPTVKTPPTSRPQILQKRKSTITLPIKQEESKVLKKPEKRLSLPSIRSRQAMT